MDEYHSDLAARVILFSWTRLRVPLVPLIAVFNYFSFAGLSLGRGVFHAPAASMFVFLIGGK